MARKRKPKYKTITKVAYEVDLGAKGKIKPTHTRTQKVENVLKKVRSAIRMARKVNVNTIVKKIQKKISGHRKKKDSWYNRVHSMEGVK